VKYIEQIVFFKEMQQNGISPNVVTYITLIHGFCMDVNTEVSLKLLRDKVKKCFIFNNYIFNVVIHKFCHDGQLSEARNFFEEMQNKGLIHDVYSHNILIDGYCKHGDMDKTFHFFFN